MRDGDILVIEPLWNEYEATKIAEHVRLNRERLGK